MASSSQSALHPSAHSKTDIPGDRADPALQWGVRWDPGRWPQDQWARDCALMVEAGIDVVTWGSGAWLAYGRGEPYHWSHVEAVLATCADAGLGVYISLPFDRVPAGIVTDVALPFAEAVVDPRGWAATMDLVQALGQHLGSDTRVVGWEIPTAWQRELAQCQSAAAQQAFRTFLQRQFHQDIEQLNRAWGLHAWSERLDHFDQVQIPQPGACHIAIQHQTDYQRWLAQYVTSLVTSCRQLLVNTHPISLAWGGPMLDVAALINISDDNSINAAWPLLPGAIADPAGTSLTGMVAGQVRHYSPHHTALIQPANKVVHGQRQPSHAPGRLEVQAVQALAQGANRVIWPSWRSVAGGAPDQPTGLLPSWGDPARVYYEVVQLLAKLAPHQDLLATAQPAVNIARLAGVHQQAALNAEPWLQQALHGLDVGQRVIAALGLNEDRLAPSELNPDYHVALLPLALGLDDADVAHLHAWVKAGGTLIVGPQAGWRDRWRSAEDVTGEPPLAPPGWLGTLTGTLNGDVTTWPEAMTIYGRTAGRHLPATCYGEILGVVAADAQVIGWHATDWLAGSPAVVSRRVGQGRVVHSGVALVDSVLQWLWVELKLPTLALAVRTFDAWGEVVLHHHPDGNDGQPGRLIYALNHGTAPAVFHVYRPMQDLISGQAVTNSFTLAGYQWRILVESA